MFESVVVHSTIFGQCRLPINGHASNHFQSIYQSMVMHLIVSINGQCIQLFSIGVPISGHNYI